MDWLAHGDSRSLSDAELLRRSIADVVDDIEAVVTAIGEAPVLVGHSMGGLASLAYACLHPVSGLALLAPPSPAAVGVKPLDVPVDFQSLWGPPPFELAWQLFFQNNEESAARAFYSRLRSESPRAVWEATRFCLDVDIDGLRTRPLIVGAEHDLLCPPDGVQALAEYVKADFRLLTGRGHNILLDPGWESTADMIASWLGANARSDGSRPRSGWTRTGRAAGRGQRRR